MGSVFDPDHDVSIQRDDIAYRVLEPPADGRNVVGRGGPRRHTFTSDMEQVPNVHDMKRIVDLTRIVSTVTFDHQRPTTKVS